MEEGGQGAWRLLSSILREALDGPLRRWAGQRVVELLIGVRRVYLELWEGWCSAVMSPYWLGVPRLREVLLRGETPRSLVRRVERERSPAAAAAGVAAVSAATMAWMASTYPLPGGIEFNKRLWDVVGVGPGDTVVMLGYMRGLALEARGRGARVVVAEYDEELLETAAGDGLPVVRGGSPEALNALRAASVAVFSGSTLLNPPRLLEELEAARAARVRVLVGASASLHPVVAERLGFNTVAGVWIDPRLCPVLRARVASGLGVHGLRGRLVGWLWVGELG